MAVIFASDHGEAFGEHGTHYHRSTLYDEQIRVPLLIAAPGIGARVIAQTVGVIDIYATVLELLGLPPTSVVDSRSLVPALRGERLPDAPYRAASWTMVEGLEPPRAWVGVFYGDFKLLRRTDWNVDEIYDLKADPRELRPNAGRAARMRRRLLSLL
jgi:arylsulfatase A-like enzyme